MNGGGVVATGLRRGVIELRHVLRSPKEYLSLLSNPIVFVTFAAIQRGGVAGGPVPSSHLVIAGGIGSLITLVGLTSLPQVLVNEREDGTLLRLRGTPGGMPAYLLGKTVYVTTVAIVNTLLLLLGGALAVGMSLPDTVGQWFTLLWVLVLGLASVAPIGAALGAVLPNAREALALVMLPVLALVAVSGVFFPLTILPQPLQDVVQIFPIKWISQGVRSVLLPDSALATETGHDWQHVRTAAVLAAWSVGGFLLAPRLLLRMSRRDSGGRLAVRRERAGQRPN